MILLDDVAHVLAWSEFAFLRKQLFPLEVTDSANVSGFFVDIDYTWGGDVRSAQDLAEKPLDYPSATSLNQEEIQCLTA